MVDGSVTVEGNWRPNVTFIETLCYRITQPAHSIVSMETEYLIGVEEAQDCYGQLGEEDQCQAEGELE